MNLNMGRVNRDFLIEAMIERLGAITPLQAAMIFFPGSKNGEKLAKKRLHILFGLGDFKRDMNPVTKLDQCKKDLEKAKATILEQSHTLTQNLAHSTKLENEKSDLNKKNTDEIAFLKKEIELDLKEKLFNQKLILQNEFDTKIAAQQKAAEEKQDVAKKEYKIETDDFFRQQSQFADKIHEAYAESDKYKGEIKTLKDQKNKDSKDLVSEMKVESAILKDSVPEIAGMKYHVNEEIMQQSTFDDLKLLKGYS